MRRQEWDFEAWWKSGEGMPIPELRQKVVRYYVKRYGSIREACKKLKLPERTMYRWINQYNIDLQ